MAKQTKTNLESKNLLVYTPMFAGLLAVVFDVGYFWPINIAYFTLFSLSEHLVFAMQAIPAVLVVMGIIGIIATFYSSLESLKTNTKLRAVLSVTIFLAMAISIIALILDYFALFAMGLVVATLCMFLKYGGRNADVSDIVLLAFAGLTTIFSVGYSLSVGRAHSEAVDVFHIKEGENLSGTLVRSGERGVLFFVPATKSYQFRDWDQIVFIERKNR